LNKEAHVPRFPLLAAVFVLFAQAAAVSAQILIRNPSIPENERLVYTEKIGSVIRTISETMVLKTEKGRSWYEFSSSSPDSETFMRLDKNTLFPDYSVTLTRGKDAVIRRTNEYLSVSIEAKADELVIPDFSSLPILLRGFPWGTVSFARLLTPGSMGGGQSFSLELNVRGRETVKINGKDHDCWKVQLGAGGALGALMGSFMGKSFYWFSTEPTHYLVRAEGPSGGPGSGQRILELQSPADQ
jgi:hypothetical protein